MDTTSSIIQKFVDDLSRQPSEILGLLLEKEMGGKKFYKRINPGDPLPPDFRQWDIVILVRGRWKLPAEVIEDSSP